MDSIKQLMDKKCIPCDAFQFDEAKAVSAKQFFSLYRDQFPMMAIITEGHYGDTQFDCYDTCQVFRIHGYTSQPRVVAVDSSEASRQRHKYLNIPIETPFKFRVVKGHQTVGEAQDLASIIEENQLPVLIQPACDRKCRVKVWGATSGFDWKEIGEFGNLLITKRFDEHFMMMQCLYTGDLNVTEYVNLLALSPEITMAPITGFAPGTGTPEQFQAYLKKLVEITEKVMQKPENKKTYDMKKGNPDWGTCFLETISLATGSGGVTSDYAPLVPFHEIYPDTGPPPALPPRKGQTSAEGQGHLESNPSGPFADENDEVVYEEIDPDYTVDESDSLKQAMQTDTNKSHSGRGITFSNLEKSIKHRLERQKLNDKTAVKSPKNIRKQKHTPTSDDETRYVRLERSEQNSRYLKIIQAGNEPVDMQGAKMYDETKVESEMTYEAFTKEEVAKMTIKELGKSLKALNLNKYVKVFKEQMIDGAIVQDLTPDDLVKEFKLSRLEALRLTKFVATGHIPK